MQQRLAFVGDHDSVSALPDRNFADVAHEQIALAFAGGRDGHAAHVLIARRGDQTQVFSNLIIHIFFGDADAGRGSEIEDTNFSAVADDGKLIDGNFLIAFDRDVALVDAEQAAGCAFRSVAHFEARAAQSIEKLRGGWIFADGQMQRTETTFERSIGVVADAGDASFAEIEHGQRFQHVIQLRGGEIYVDILAAAHLAGVLKVADSIFVKNHAGYRQAGGGISRVGL